MSSVEQQLSMEAGPQLSIPSPPSPEQLVEAQLEPAPQQSSQQKLDAPVVVHISLRGHAAGAVHVGQAPGSAGAGG